jgi:hypothetical protein
MRPSNGRPVLADHRQDADYRTHLERLQTLRHKQAETEKVLASATPEQDAEACLEADARHLLAHGSIPDRSKERDARRAHQEAHQRAEAALPVITRAIAVAERELAQAEERAAEKAAAASIPWLRERAQSIVGLLKDLVHESEAFRQDLQWLNGELPRLARGNGHYVQDWRPVSVPEPIDAKLFTELRNYCHHQLAALVGPIDFPD